MIRRLTTTPLRVLLRRSFVLLYLLAVALGAAGFVAVTSVNHRLDNLVGTLQPLAAGNASALTDMVDAETGLRGFELTGRQTFLQPYRHGTADFPRALAGARSLARGDRSVTAMLDTERVAADNWIIGYAQPRVSGLAAPSAAGATAGKALFDRFRATNARVAASVQARIAAARSDADLARNVALGVLAGLLALTVAAGTYTGLRLLRRVVPPLESVTGAILRLAGGESRLDVTEEGTAELVALARAVKHLDRENLRRQLADRRRQRLRVLAANVAREVSQHLDLEELLATCAGIIATAFDVERVVLWLSEGGAPPGLITEWRAAGLPALQQMGGPAWADEALQCVIDELGDRPVLCAGPRDDSAALRSCTDAFGAATMIACRSGAGDDCVATLALFDGGDREWEPEDVAAVQTVTGDVAGAIRRARLFADEQRLRRDLEALEKAQADFVATVSHELRTPLTSVRGYVELLRDGSVDDDADRDRMLAVVERNTGRLQALVDELLTLSRIEAGTLNESSHEVAMGEVMSKVAVTLEPQAATGGVALDLEGVGAGVVRGDAGQLEQIVVNLVSNAVKFTPPGGRVTLACRTEGPDVVLTVADNGIGIPVEDQEKLGGRFFRASNATDRAIPGTGLGIRIVKGLVDHHGGSIDLDSEPGLGTTWTVRLPRAGAAV